MYKIKSVEIINMHNYDHRIFKFDSDITYICGKNGKGKSTILQAIQLGLYGFIPGQSKLNKDIIKNSNSNYLKIILTLIEGNNTIEITRSWEKSGASVKSSVTTVPEDISIDFADSVLLPIIDFNSFCDLSTENQKKWFLQYLDIDTNNVDWSVVFDAIFESEENKDALKQSIQKQFFNNIPKKSTSVYDDVNAVHNFAKQAESLAKQFTLTSLYADEKNYSTNISNIAKDKNEEPFIIGVIKIDKIKIDYPILSSTTDELLKIAPCRFAGPMPNEIGNLCIAGHNYIDNTFFAKITKLEKDDEIFIYDLNGNVNSYYVTDRYEIENTDFSCTTQETNGEKWITLMTCNSLKCTRIIVRAIF